MNYLPIIAIVIFLLLKSNKDYKNILTQIPIEDIASVLPILGIDQNTSKMIITILPVIMSGNIDLQTLIKNIIPMLISNAQNSEKENEEKFTPDFSDIEGIANSEILSSLNSYFS